MCLAFSHPALAEIPNADLVCDPAIEEIDHIRFMRSVSLDLVGNIPPHDITETLIDKTEIPEVDIDALLDSDAFVERAVRWHRNIIWNNIGNTRLLAVRGSSRTTNAPGAIPVYWRSGSQAIFYRGLSNRSCLLTQAAPQEQCDGTAPITTNVDGQEGYCMVEPYWAMGTTVRACAFDAQDAIVSTTGTECYTNDGYNDMGCGCGPNMRWCGTSNQRRTVAESFGMEIEERIRNLVKNNRPYTELFTSNQGYVNGPIVHFWKNWALLPGGVLGTPYSVPVELLPDLDFNDLEFQAIDLPTEHAGILTSPAYLIRFQTNRSRASQFYAKFLCQPLQAPGTLPVADIAAQMEPDLQKRGGCLFCHAMLEPAASFWGRWGQQGFGLLNLNDYPALSDECHLCATTGMPCSSDCSRYYKVNSNDPSEEPYLGKLNAYLFRAPEHDIYVEMGPKLLALSSFADNRLPECTARTAAMQLLGRDLHEDEESWLDQLVVEFAASGYNYKALIKAIVLSPIYRRVR
jgi:hypothetical protein